MSRREKLRHSSSAGEQQRRKKFASYDEFFNGARVSWMRRQAKMFYDRGVVRWVSLAPINCLATGR